MAKDAEGKREDELRDFSPKPNETKGETISRIAAFVHSCIKNERLQAESKLSHGKTENL